MRLRVRVQAAFKLFDGNASRTKAVEPDQNAATPKRNVRFQESPIKMVSVSAEATAMVVAPEVDSSAVLEDFINKVTKDIPAPLLDKPTRRRRVDPVLIDAPPQLPSSEASGLRRSLRQALDPLSAVKTARRGEMILMRRLGEIGVPLPLAASADQAVKQFFLEGPAPHHMGALLDIYPMLKTKSTTSPSVGLSVD
ncbi:unnamed protein product [Urochloa humidicola]